MASEEPLGIDVKLISLSAFFADFGYQAVIVGLPLFIVLVLRAPVYYYGIAEALNYGIGSLFSYAGGKLSSRYGSKRIAIIGNSLIPVLSFTGFATSVYEAIALFAGGWWARNFRSPARRVMMSSSVSEANRSRAYGLLHGLDVGGGILATLIFILLISLGYSFRLVFLLTLIPLLVSTLVLVPVHSGGKGDNAARSGNKGKPLFRSIIVASALFGFSYYSMGFLVLTVAIVSKRILLGALTYTIFLAVASSVGFLMSRIRVRHETRSLGLAGYILAGIGALSYALSLLLLLPVPYLYLSTVIIGLGSGFIEVLEPTIISKVSGNIGTGMGWLSASRSAGLFFANIFMGFLFFINPSYSYFYAFAVAFTAGIIVIIAGRSYDDSMLKESMKPA